MGVDLQENHCILPWNQSRYLTFTSALFFTSAIYSYSCRFYFLSGVAALTSIISANFWRKPEPSLRRAIDLIYSKISCSIFVCNGVFYVRRLPDILTFYPILGGMIYFFYLSNLRYSQKKEDWWKYHVLFHIMVLSGQLGIINSKWHVLHGV